MNELKPVGLKPQNVPLGQEAVLKRRFQGKIKRKIKTILLILALIPIRGTGPLKGVDKDPYTKTSEPSCFREIWPLYG
jgi:hypothetical protein